MVERRQQLLQFGIADPALDTDGALTARRQAVLGRDGSADARFETEANQACSSENDGVVLTGIQLGQAGVDVATQEMDFQIRAAGQQLGLAAQAGGANQPVV